MGRVNNFINRKMLESAGAIQERADKYIKNVVPNMSAKKECQTVLQLSRVIGIPAMRQQILDGFRNEWDGKSVDDIDTEIQRYRDEPLFEKKVMSKFSFTWDEIEKIKDDVLNGDNSTNPGN